MTRLRDLAEGAVVLLAGFGGLVFAVAAGFEDAAVVAVALAALVTVGVLIEGWKRLSWDGSMDRCEECGAEIRSYHRYCADCQPTRNPGGGA